MALRPDWNAITLGIEAMVREVAQRVTGEPVVVVQWEHNDGALPIGHDFWIELNVRSTRDLGQAEVRKEDNPTPTPGEERLVVVTAPSTFILSIKVPSNKQTPGSRLNSRAIVSALRTAMSAPEYRRSLDQAGCAFARVVRELGEIEDPRSKRDRSYAVLEAQFNTASAYDARPDTYIETIRVSGAVTHPQGVATAPRQDLT